MAWQSKFAAKFTKPLIRQIIGIVNRDIQAALDDVSGVAGSLKPFAQWDLAAVVLVNFPAFVITPHSVEFDAEALGTLKQAVPITCAVAVTHQDANTCAEFVEDYVRAVDEVLNSAWWLSPGDFYLTTLPLPSPLFAPGATSPGLTPGSLTRLFVGGHAYDELRRTRQGLFATAATVSLVCELEEG